MKTLAIHGHSVRSKEVIEILEMLGGENKANLSGNGLCIYYIDCNNRINLSSKLQDKFVTFHLEEFLEKYPYKVGDMVQHKGSTSCRSIYRIEKMIWKNNQINYVVYNPWQEYDKCTIIAEYLQPYKEEPEKERKYTELRLDPSDDDKLATEVVIRDGKILPPNGYLIGKITDVDNGMLVEFVKKQPKYPKTYEESCEVISINRHDVEIDIPQPYQQNIAHFFRLLICRDAYWKIADNWKPYWNNDTQFKFIITCRRDNIIKDTYTAKNCILAFPTEEMRDIFLENFKNLIEKCKEFL